jgi:hypothetical protein
MMRLLRHRRSRLAVIPPRLVVLLLGKEPLGHGDTPQAVD